MMAMRYVDLGPTRVARGNSLRWLEEQCPDCGEWCGPQPYGSQPSCRKDLVYYHTFTCAHCRGRLCLGVLRPPGCTDKNTPGAMWRLLAAWQLEASLAGETRPVCSQCNSPARWEA